MNVITRAMCCLMFVAAPFAQAQTSNEIDAFVNRMKAKTYDCPESGFVPQLDAYLQNDQLEQTSIYKLQVEKSHAMICNGKLQDAYEMMRQLIDREDFDPASEAYARAIYQLGFILDIREDARRCEYYSRAETLAKDKFADVYLSAQLGLITACSGIQQDNSGIKLGRLYSVLKEHADTSGRAELAHIHNSIGLLYASLGQNALASEQYQKSYEMGLGEYTGSNLAATLVSLVTSHMATGDFDSAKAAIAELKQINTQINTPLSNVWVHLSESGYFYRTGDYARLAISLAKYEVFLPEISSATYTGIHRWYSAALCLHNRDRACLEAFVKAEEQAPESYKAHMNRNKDYSRFRVEIALFFGDIALTEQRFASFADVMVSKLQTQQASGKVLGVANLHSQIVSLESSLAESEQRRVLSLTLAVLISLLVLALVIYWLKRKHMIKLSSDPLTGLSNTRAVINQIGHVSSPDMGKINAIALFDLDNYKEINGRFGHIAGDKALKLAASTLRLMSREKDIFGRLASEQFILCLKNVDENMARELFERTRLALEKAQLNLPDGEKVEMQFSTSTYLSTDKLSDIVEVLSDLQASLQKPVVQSAAPSMG